MQFVPEHLRLERSLQRAQEVMSQALANFEREARLNMMPLNLQLFPEKRSC